MSDKNLLEGDHDQETQQGRIYRHVQHPDILSFRIVVTVISLIAVGVITSAIYDWLHNKDDKIETFVITIGSGAMGALGGLLAPTPGRE